MDKPLFTFRSMTQAMKAKDILYKANIVSYLKKVHISDKNGCAYALYIPQNQDKAEKILGQNNINIVKIIKEEEP